MCIYLCICMHKQTDRQTNKHTYIHTCIHIYIHTYIAYIHACLHTCIHTYIHPMRTELGPLSRVPGLKGPRLRSCTSSKPTSTKLNLPYTDPEQRSNPVETSMSRSDCSTWKMPCLTLDGIAVALRSRILENDADPQRAGHLLVTCGYVSIFEEQLSFTHCTLGALGLRARAQFALLFILLAIFCFSTLRFQVATRLSLKLNMHTITTITVLKLSPTAFCLITFCRCTRLWSARSATKHCFLSLCQVKGKKEPTTIYEAAAGTRPSRCVHCRVSLCVHMWSLLPSLVRFPVLCCLVVWPFRRTLNRTFSIS